MIVLVLVLLVQRNYTIKFERNSIPSALFDFVDINCDLDMVDYVIHVAMIFDQNDVRKHDYENPKKIS